jgi:tetratricopeptide (TPR) repeat protein
MEFDLARRILFLCPYMKPDWRRVLEAPTHELPLLSRDQSLDSELRAYAGVLASFLQGDAEKLAAIAESLPAGPLREISRLRLMFRRRTFNANDLLGSAAAEGVLEAERQFCLGMAWEHLNDDARSMEHFAGAAAIYREHGCPKKALRSMYNAIAAETRVHPHKNFVADFQAVIEASKAVGDAAFEGMALIQLAREYQVAGALDRALNMIERAVGCLASERGTFHYFHALLNHAHVLMDLRRDPEARAVLKETELASFPQITAARELLLCALDSGRVWDRKFEKDLLPTWRNRLAALTSPTTESGASSELEKRLLKFVYNGPVEKWDLITRLYPGEDSSLALENRFKNLVARVRKKYPVNIQCVEGRYSLDKMPPL